jgi:PEP-CTERM motif-containing protein
VPPGFKLSTTWSTRGRGTTRQDTGLWKPVPAVPRVGFTHREKATFRVNRVLKDVDFFVTDTFTLPASLLPSLPAGSWALALKLTESTNQTDSITLDWATLSVTYNEVAPVASAPEPATLTLLGTGAALALLRRRRQKRQVV